MCRGRAVGDAMRRRHSVSVRAADRVRRYDAMQLVSGGVVSVVAPTVTAREAEESHRGHASGAEYHAEDVEVHRSQR
jgi:hypothetical protein